MMTVSRATVRALVPGSVRTAAFEVTKRCPLRCRHCYNDNFEKEVGPELTMDEWSTIFRMFPRLETGILTGGEPLARDDIGELVEGLSRLCRSVIILTSGQVSGGGLLEKIRRTGASLQIQISEIGERYDEMTGKSGGFRLLEKNILELALNHIPFTTSLVMSMENLERLERIFQFHRAIGSRHILAIRYVPQSHHENWQRSILPPDRYREALSVLDGFVGDGGVPVSMGIPNLPCVAAEDDHENIFFPYCSAGEDYIAVDERGRIKICPHHTRTGPSLLDTGPEAALREMRELLDKTLRLPPGCRGCGYAEKCGGGCRGGAFSLCSEGGGPDPMLAFLSVRKAE